MSQTFYKHIATLYNRSLPFFILKWHISQHDKIFWKPSFRAENLEWTTGTINGIRNS